MGNNSKARGDVVAAERYYQKAYRRLPNRLYPLYLLAKLYFETGQDDKAREMADRVLSFDPKVPSTAVREMKGEIRRLRRIRPFRPKCMENSPDGMEYRSECINFE